jgi:hypothetical protein
MTILFDFSNNRLVENEFPVEFGEIKILNKENKIEN